MFPSTNTPGLSTYQDPYAGYGFSNTAPVSQTGVQNAALGGAFTGGSTVPGLQVLQSGGPVNGGTSDTGTYTDPNAAANAAAASKSAALSAAFGTQHQNLLDTTNSTFDSYGQNKYNPSILTLLDNMKIGQNNLDTQATQNELAKRTGTQSVLDMVGQGIRSGGVTLNNKNAGTSSAAQGIADAYAQLGRGQLSSVGNQYALGQNKLANDQNTFNIQEQGAVRGLITGKNDYVNSIINDTRDKLGQLQTQMTYASLPDRIAIEQEVATIKQNALNNLQQYDTQLNQGVGGIHPIGQDAAREQATQLAQAGQAPANAFQFNTQAPAQFANSGPFASDIPLFSTPRTKTQVA